MGGGSAVAADAELRRADLLTLLAAQAPAQRIEFGLESRTELERGGVIHLWSPCERAQATRRAGYAPDGVGGGEVVKCGVAAELRPELGAAKGNTTQGRPAWGGKEAQTEICGRTSPACVPICWRAAGGGGSTRGAGRDACCMFTDPNWVAPSRSFRGRRGHRRW